MSFFKAGWWRPASALIVLALAVAAFSAGGRGTALAVTTDGSVSVTPADLMIGAGGTGQLSVDMTPAAAGTSIWIVEIAYDPAVAQVATDGSGNPVCTSLNVTVALPGAAGVGGCAVKAVSHGSTPDTLVILGGAVLNDNGTATGFTTPQTLATFTFNAVGASGAHTALTTTVTAFLGPNGQTPTPATSDGAIDITPGTSRIWGDGDCGGDIGPRDAQAVLKNVLVQTPLSQTQPCPAIGAQVTVDGVSRIWSDWDCGGDIGPRDAQAILKNVLVQSPLSQTQPCPAVGSTVQVVG
jgi:hypothetical protein